MKSRPGPLLPAQEQAEHDLEDDDRGQRERTARVSTQGQRTGCVVLVMRFKRNDLGIRSDKWNQWKYEMTFGWKMWFGRRVHLNLWK